LTVSCFDPGTRLTHEEWRELLIPQRGVLIGRCFGLAQMHGRIDSGSRSAD
jgi:hypothetical protein